MEASLGDAVADVDVCTALHRDLAPGGNLVLRT